MTEQQIKSPADEVLDSAVQGFMELCNRKSEAIASDDDSDVVTAGHMRLAVRRVLTELGEYGAPYNFMRRYVKGC